MLDFNKKVNWLIYNNNLNEAYAGKGNTCICKWVQYLSQNNEKNLPYQNSPVLRDSLTCLKYQ